MSMYLEALYDHENILPDCKTENCDNKAVIKDFQGNVFKGYLCASCVLEKISKEKGNQK